MWQIYFSYTRDDQKRHRRYDKRQACKLESLQKRNAAYRHTVRILIKETH